VISRKGLREFAAAHPDSEQVLDTWYRVAKGAKWAKLFRRTKGLFGNGGGWPVYCFQYTRQSLSVDHVIHYPSRTIFIRAVLTHAEYDKDKWNHE